MASLGPALAWGAGNIRGEIQLEEMKRNREQARLAAISKAMSELTGGLIKGSLEVGKGAVGLGMKLHGDLEAKKARRAENEYRAGRDKIGDELNREKLDFTKSQAEEDTLRYNERQDAEEIRWNEERYTKEQNRKAAQDLAERQLENKKRHQERTRENVTTGQLLETDRMLYGKENQEKNRAARARENRLNRAARRKGKGGGGSNKHHPADKGGKLAGLGYTEDAIKAGRTEKKWASYVKQYDRTQKKHAGNSQFSANQVKRQLEAYQLFKKNAPYEDWMRVLDGRAAAGAPSIAPGQPSAGSEADNIGGPNYDGEFHRPYARKSKRGTPKGWNFDQAQADKLKRHREKQQGLGERDFANTPDDPPEPDEWTDDTPGQGSWDAGKDIRVSPEQLRREAENAVGESKTDKTRADAATGHAEVLRVLGPQAAADYERLGRILSKNPDFSLMTKLEGLLDKALEPGASPQDKEAYRDAVREEIHPGNKWWNIGGVPPKDPLPGTPKPRARPVPQERRGRQKVDPELESILNMMRSSGATPAQLEAARRQWEQPNAGQPGWTPGR